MHIVMFGDQHPDSLGGAQVSMRLQRRFLLRAGHDVTIVGPTLHAMRASRLGPDPTVIELPSRSIAKDGEYSWLWPGSRNDDILDGRMRARPAPDLVHVQADFWGALLGYRYARRHGIPVVHTMHNRVDVGIQALTPFSRTALRVLNSWRRLALPGSPRGTDGWGHLRALVTEAVAVTAPSAHFARRLEQHRVFEPVDVIWNGIDDDILAEVQRNGRRKERGRRPTLVWAGRMSPEKRLLPFLRALAASEVDVDVEIIGSGAEEREAKAFVAREALRARVTFRGGLPYRETLESIALADAMVQTSIGFETQGMTVFEAAAFGVPSIVCDLDIADELGAGVWRVPIPDVEHPGGIEEARVMSLAETLRRAEGDIRAGTAPLSEQRVAEAFRQSSRTRAMIEVYERVLDL